MVFLVAVRKTQRTSVDVVDGSGVMTGATPSDPTQQSVIVFAPMAVSNSVDYEDPIPGDSVLLRVKEAITNSGDPPSMVS